MNKLSDIYGRRIYDRNSGFIGVANDVLIEPETGKIKFLLKQDASSIIGRDRVEVKEFVKENFIPFESVKAVRDIIVLG